MGNLQSNASSSTQTTGKKNDIFLNFRGVDTRDGFTNYLYEALLHKSIETFMDEVGIEKGEEIWPKLAKKISDSLIFEAIFSKEYASSKWCLRELIEIMKSGQIVIPVFYKVTIHDVRHQEGKFKDGFDRLEKEFQENLEKVQVDSADVEKRKQEFDEEKRNWRQALKAACDLKGWPYENGPKLKVIDEIVKDISKKLMRAYKLSPSDFKGLFGFEERFKQVMSLLSLDNTDIRIIGIWGMGGIGKTTLADANFNQIFYDKYGKCFVRNVRQRLEQCGGLVSVLQQEVLSVVLNDPNVKFYCVTLPQHIKERLCRKKVFIVLDDVDDFLKLEELAGGLHQLGPGSKIVITTRRDVLKMCEVNDDYIYEVKGLSNHEAHQLFCQYAFRHNPPTKDLMTLSHETLQAINGNPLALKVAGLSLFELNKIEWQSALSGLKKSLEILEVLQISYNRLAPEHQDTFLDIACFFVGKNEDYVVKRLDCPYSLKVLSNRSLITISNNKIIQMHDLLQEMGREIVRKEDLNNPGNRSRLLTQEVILDTLKNGYGTNAIKGIFLNMSQMNEEHLNSQAFEKMTNLVILKIYDSTFMYNGFDMYSSKVYFPDGISYLSNKLKSLNWLGYPLKTLPSNFNPAYLTELYLRCSNVEVLWGKSTRAPKLKWIFLETCPYLSTVSSHLDAQGLEKIDIKYCNSFHGLTSCDRFPSLTYLYLKGCNKLTQISDHLDAPSLKEICIQDCDNFLGFTSCDRFPSLTNLYLKGCNKLTRISDHLDAPSLEKIYIFGCNNFLGFTSRDCFPSLRYLHFYRCNKLTQISFHLDARLLEKIYIECCDELTHISDHLDAPSLEEIDILWCGNFLGFTSHDCFPSLTYLQLTSCNKLTQISDHLNAPSLEKIGICDCYRFIGFTSHDCFPSLRYLDLKGCHQLTRISGHLDAPLLEEINILCCCNFLGFTSHDRFPSLTYLCLKGCNKLTQISDHLDAPSLKKIDIQHCDSFLGFAPHDHFPSLTYLYLERCDQLTTISECLDAPSLEQIHIKFCDNLLHFPPPAQHFNKLCEVQMRHCKNLNLIWCQRLQSLPNIVLYPSLKSLTLYRCHKPIKTSDLFYAPSIEVIDVCECSALLEFSSPVDRVFYNLRKVRVMCCENLQSFGKNIHFPSLVSVDLSECDSLTGLADFLDAPSLEKISL